MESRIGLAVATFIQAVPFGRAAVAASPGEGGHGNRPVSGS
jgi:hypothetical protein